MSSLAKALREERWQDAALCLLMGMSRALGRVPPDTVAGLLEAVEGIDDVGANEHPGR